MNFPQSQRKSGFSLIELVITMTILSILVGVVSFRSGAVVERGKATKISSLVDTLKTACTLHHADTGTFATEEGALGSASDHKLTATQTSAGWSGPYLETPLVADNHNPFGSLKVYSTVTGDSYNTGFDLDGDGTNDQAGAGNMLKLDSVPIKVAQMLDDTFDRGVAGDWEATGRVQYNASATRVMVLLYY
ncbi:MAG: prepilin-type N-terminal cleavage/methylation domain-containing protein [Planctomycetota bacterium]|jgi:prepilin-type N-terminal cleavage/methylation domain-containing protein